MFGRWRCGCVLNERSPLVVLQLVAACNVGTGDRDVPNVPCGPAIEIAAKADDTIVLNNAAGEVLAVVSTPSDGRVSLDAPDCSNSVTVISKYYSFGEQHALTVTDVAPGTRIDFTVDRWNSQPPQEQIPISVQYPVLEDTFTGWCVLVPSELRATTFPSLPNDINPTEPPTAYAVSTIETSLVTSYDDVVRAPFRAFAAPWSGGPDLRIRTSMLGFVPPPWWWL